MLTIVNQTSITDPEERQARFKAIESTFVSYEYALFGDFDEHEFKGRDIGFDSFVRATIAAYKIGFAIVCGHPPKAWSSHRERGSCGDWTLVILRLLDWVHEYGSLQTMGNRIQDFVLRHGNPYDAPFTYMRIACLLKSEVLYKISIAAAVASYERSIVEWHKSGDGPHGYVSRHPLKRTVEDWWR